MDYLAQYNVLQWLCHGGQVQALIVRFLNHIKREAIFKSKS